MQTTEAVIAIIGMLVAFGLPLLLVAVILFYKHRRQRMIHETIARLAERAEEIDISRAEAARTRAQQRVEQQPQSDVDYERARVALTKALTRLQVAARVPGGMRVGELKRMRETRA